MRKIHLVIVGLGVMGLAAGCASSKGDIQEIAYQGSSDDATILPKKASGAISEGTADSGDEAIAPITDVPGAAEYAAGPGVAPTPETVPSVETPPSLPTPVVEGDGVVDSAPDIGTPPLPAPVSCDEKNFAFVSKRGGVPNVYVERHGSQAKVTANDTGWRNYANLEVRPGGDDFAADETTLLVFIPLVRSAFGSSEGPEALTTLPGEGFTRGFAWNHEGTKAAYLRSTPDRGHLSTAIHYVTNLGTMATQRDMVVDPNGDYHVGRIAWWGNNLVVSFDFASGPVITVIDPERYPLFVQPVALVGSESAALDAPKLEGSQPAVSKNGQLAFMRKRDDGRSAIAVCNLQDVPGRYEASRQCAGLRIINAPGNNDSPAFSPDGRWIYFVSDRDGNREIYRMHADGTGEERLTNDPAEDASPAPFAANAGCE